MSEALDQALADHARAVKGFHEATDRLTETARNSILHDEAFRLALKVAPQGNRTETTAEIEQAFQHIYRLTKSGKLG